jgi:hypothetical protein
VKRTLDKGMKEILKLYVYKEWKRAFVLNYVPIEE